MYLRISRSTACERNTNFEDNQQAIAIKLSVFLMLF